jgi:GWxTD domain-containing protein
MLTPARIVAPEPSSPVTPGLQQSVAVQKASPVELSQSLKKWVDEDVAYIISDEEKRAFENLSSDEERQQFIEQFWLRRDPTPGTPRNEFKEEHYERIVYANERFSSGKPGWKTDRGRLYIIHGKPDQIESHPSVEFISAHSRMVAVPFRPIRSRYGHIGISKGSAILFASNSSIEISAATTS